MGGLKKSSISAQKVKRKEVILGKTMWMKLWIEISKTVEGLKKINIMSGDKSDICRNLI